MPRSIFPFDQKIAIKSRGLTPETMGINRAHRYSEDELRDFRETLGDIAQFVIPTEPSDVALAALAGPFGRPVKGALTALAGALYSPESEAGWFSRAAKEIPQLWQRYGRKTSVTPTESPVEVLNHLPEYIRPENLSDFRQTFAEALDRSRRTGFEHAAISSSPSNIFTDNDPMSVKTPLSAWLRAAKQGEYLHGHTHPSGFARPSYPDLSNVSDRIGLYPGNRQASMVVGTSPGQGSPYTIMSSTGNDLADMSPDILKDFDQNLRSDVLYKGQALDYAKKLGMGPKEYSNFIENTASLYYPRHLAEQNKLYLAHQLGEIRPPDSPRLGISPAFEEFYSKFVRPKFAEGGVVPSLTSWLENKKRVGKRTLADWFSDPDESARLAAARINEANREAMKDPSAGANWLGGPLGGLAGVIKPKGGQWLKGNVEDALKPLRPRVFGALMPPETLKLPEAMKNPDLALDAWIQGPLTKYVKNQMATPEDPIRALAEQGILHVSPEGFAPRNLRYGRQGRQLADIVAPGSGARLGESPLAQAWEDLTDTIIVTEKLGDIKNRSGISEPWMESSSPQMRVNVLDMPDTLLSEGGFSHLRDELSNALNPESGLPRELLLRPEQMQQMGIDRAVRHVDKINKWRAKEMEKARTSEMKDIPVVKEYPEGFKWVELRAPELPEGWEKEGLDVFGPGGVQEQAGKRGDPRREKLEKWLKSEGDQMGHCVGGYCEDVLSGSSRIFSLRDSKGQPHVTVQVEPYQGTPGRDVHGEIEIPPSRIVQIKGKSNMRPKDEYLPFVQDFIKSQGPWSEVGDIRNAGMYRAKDLYSDVERDWLKSQGFDPGDYLSADEYKQLNEIWDKAGGVFPPPPGFEMADGGVVPPLPPVPQRRGLRDPIQDFLEM